MTRHALRTHIILPALTLIVGLPVVAWNARPELLTLRTTSSTWAAAETS